MGFNSGFKGLKLKKRRQPLSFEDLIAKIRMYSRCEYSIHSSENLTFKNRASYI